MKYLLSLISFWAISASANPICSSIWVFKPFGVCAHPSHGLNLSAPGIPSGEMDLKSDALRGGANQEKVCEGLQASFNRANLGNGQFASLTQPTPVREDSKRNALGEVKYTYWCHVSIQRYPIVVKASPACGLEERYTYSVIADGRDLPGVGTCLSCDDVSAPEAKVACLKSSLKNVIEPRLVELRDSDLFAVSAQMAKVLKVNKFRPIQGLQDDVNTLSEFAEFVTLHPPRH